MPVPETPKDVAAGRSRLWLVAVAAAAVVLAAGFFVLRSRSGSRGPEKPNVLLVTIDTLRADRLGCYGYAKASTPTLDGLAARGVRFATAVAHVPLTTPSHASILTGLTPLRHGVRDNGQALPAQVATLAETFRGAGYRTAAFVSGFPLDRRFGLDRGFETYDDRLPHGSDARRSAYVERPAGGTTKAALAWLEGRQEPWFLWVHYFDPHSPYEPPPEFAAGASKEPYDGEIAYVDAQIASLLRRLDENALRRRTLVLVTADHGESLGEHGEATHGVFVYDSTLRVPFILAGREIPAGRVASTVARLVDVAPTLLDVAGVPHGAPMDGRSLWPAALGKELPDAPAYAESLYALLRLGWAPLHAWRTARHKLIEAPRPELYALDADAGERVDTLAENAPIAESLRRDLRAAMSVAVPETARDATTDARERLRALGYVGGSRPVVATGRDPKDGIALIDRLERAMAEVRSGPSRAARELQAVLAEDPHMALARSYRALALSSAGERAQAARELEALDREGTASFEDLLLLADNLRLLGRPAEALPVLARAERLQPRSPEPGLTRARVLMATGKTRESEAEFEEVLRKAPGHAEALRGLGDAALARGDVAAAGRRYGDILAADPQDVGALVKLGVVRVRAGALDEAHALLRQAVDRHPRHAEALLALGGVLAKSGRPAEAIPFFERAIDAGAPSPTAMNSLGFARLETGDRSGALAALRSSLAADPRQSQIARIVGELSRGRAPAAMPAERP
jgi:arylsulfatase A-like enzyme/Tfp pilus assembly protein PilF